LVASVLDIHKVWINGFHVLNHIPKRMQDRNREGLLQIKLSSCDSFRHLIVGIGDGIRERSREFAEPISLQKEIEVLVVW
jgi:hypothetical protein